MSLTQKNNYENELIKTLKSNFKSYINSDLFSFDFAKKKEYCDKLAKLLNKDNILKLSQYPNNVIKGQLDGKINLI